MNTIYILPIEPIDQRYTKQWYDIIPEIIKDASSEFNIVVIDGEQITDSVTAGAFLNFGATNIYKSSQISSLSKLFANNEIISGDKILITDAWNPGIINIKYMSELLDIPVEIHGIWHAGAYDPTDILGMKLDKSWVSDFERSIFNCCDYNYYASNFHRDMFLRNLSINDTTEKAIRSGQPHNSITKQITVDLDTVEKNNNIIWPHRYNSDKQPEIAEDIDTMLGNVIITSKLDLNKSDYYELLKESKIIFSCSLHENLGISMMEGCLSGAIPIVPDRASYSEMYLHCFKYPSLWTESFENYQIYKNALIKFITDRIENYDYYLPKLKIQNEILLKDYLSADIMLTHLTRKNND